VLERVKRDEALRGGGHVAEVAREVTVRGFDLGIERELPNTG
jgi:hypothetical protein